MNLGIDPVMIKPLKDNLDLGIKHWPSSLEMPTLDVKIKHLRIKIINNHIKVPISMNTKYLSSFPV